MYWHFASLFFVVCFAGFSWNSRQKPYADCDYPTAVVIAALLAAVWPVTFLVGLTWVIWLIFGDTCKDS